MASALRRIHPDAVFATREDADLRDREATRRLFDRVRPGAVIHLAAAVGGVLFNRDRNAELLLGNTQIDLNVLDAANATGVARLIAMLSSCAYHLPGDRPADERDLHVGEPFSGNMGYALAKRLLDRACRLLATEGCRFSSLTPVSIYGPNDSHDLDRSHVVAALVRRALAARATGGALPVWGTGRAVRQFIYVDDVARLLLDERDRFDGPETTIVAPDAGITIAELAAAIARATRFEGPIEFTGALEGEPVKVLASRHFAARYPGRVFTPLADGLARTVASIDAHAL